MKTRRFSRPWSSGILVLLTIAAVAMLMTAGHATPAEPAAETSAEPAEPSPAPAEAKKFRGRLPMYFGLVVDEKQRQAIYAIQEEHFAEIEELKENLAALVKQRDAKVAAVLTPEQTAEVEQAKAAAKAKREARKAAAASTQ